MTQPRTQWTTPKGTVLPILNLRGKEYLQVAQRIVWFREEFPSGRIDTECVKIDDKMAHFRAIISVPTNIVQDKCPIYAKLADADKIEYKTDFADYMEKAQTSAIGRALALCGYGTAFCADELEEGDRLADAPTSPASEIKPNIVPIVKPINLARSTESIASNTASDPQKKLIWARLKNELNLSDDEAREYIFHYCKVKSSKDLTREDIKILLEAIDTDCGTKNA